ncbi:MAG TPA: hypothetical protein VHC47_09660 [Mucilaginibacter sp.]|nr:hypothetical protein [Mucilaginibacter sp.]
MEPENNITTADNGKTVAIVSYLTIIGWLVAYLGMHNEKKTELGSYQLRQTLLLYICMAGFYIAGYILLIITVFISLFLVSLLGIIMWLGGIGFLVLWIIGLIGAANGEKKPIPLIGEKAQTMFKGI